MLRTRYGLTTLVASLVALSLVGAVPANAHTSHNHGTIKVHDDETVDPPKQNNPHVSCNFWIEGFDMSDDVGHLDFYLIPPSSNPPVLVHSANWTADEETGEERFHFLAGPFNFTAGHYRVEAFLGGGHPGNHEHFSKTKTFWVNPCVVEVTPPDCPPNLTATAESDGDVRLDWDAVEGATEYRVYRAVEGDDLEFLATVLAPLTTFTDDTGEVGVTYTYAVTAVVAGSESDIDEDCTVTATPIPFFPSALVGAVAVLGGAAVYGRMRRRA